MSTKHAPAPMIAAEAVDGADRAAGARAVSAVVDAAGSSPFGETPKLEGLSPRFS